MKLYDLVKELLEEKPQRRDSDKMLMFAVYRRLGFVQDTCLDYENFIQKRCPTPESITRCRRKIQELHPELGGSRKVTEARKEKEDQKGTHIFREKV